MFVVNDNALTLDDFIQLQALLNYEQAERDRHIRECQSKEEPAIYIQPATPPRYIQFRREINPQASLQSSLESARLAEALIRLKWLKDQYRRQRALEVQLYLENYRRQALIRSMLEEEEERYYRQCIAAAVEKARIQLCLQRYIESKQLQLRKEWAEKPAEVYQQTIGEYQQPIKVYEQPSEGYRQSIKGYEQSTEEYRQPVEGYGQPIEEYQQPVEGYDASRTERLENLLQYIFDHQNLKEVGYEKQVPTEEEQVKNMAQVWKILSDQRENEDNDEHMSSDQDYEGEYDDSEDYSEDGMSEEWYGEEEDSSPPSLVDQLQGLQQEHQQQYGQQQQQQQPNEQHQILDQQQQDLEQHQQHQHFEQKQQHFEQQQQVHEQEQYQSGQKNQEKNDQEQKDQEQKNQEQQDQEQKDQEQQEQRKQESLEKQQEYQQGQQSPQEESNQVSQMDEKETLQETPQEPQPGVQPENQPENHHPKQHAVHKKKHKHQHKKKKNKHKKRQHKHHAASSQANKETEFPPIQDHVLPLQKLIHKLASEPVLIGEQRTEFSDEPKPSGIWAKEAPVKKSPTKQSPTLVPVSTNAAKAPFLPQHIFTEAEPTPTLENMPNTPLGAQEEEEQEQQGFEHFLNTVAAEQKNEEVPTDPRKVKMYQELEKIADLLSDPESDIVKRWRNVLNGGKDGKQRLDFSKQNEGTLLLSASTPFNRQFLGSEDELLRTMLRLDAVDSFGDVNIREERKKWVKKCESMLEDLDHYKQSQWEKAMIKNK